MRTIPKIFVMLIFIFLPMFLILLLSHGVFPSATAYICGIFLSVLSVYKILDFSLFRDAKKIHLILSATWIIVAVFLLSNIFLRIHSIFNWGGWYWLPGIYLFISIVNYVTTEIVYSEEKRNYFKSEKQRKPDQILKLNFKDYYYALKWIFFPLIMSILFVLISSLLVMKSKNENTLITQIGLFGTYFAIVIYFKDKVEQLKKKKKAGPNA